ncbi:MAG: hypothetical protein PHN88_02790 [Ignavibacteria bacterium]|nr:hypothetical protein [Ignavibacteria bacterium]
MKQDENSINQILKSVPKSSAETRKVIEIIGNTLILCDIHSPYHNQQAIQTALKYTSKLKNIKNVILLGDVIDFFTISKFQKNPKYPNLQFELEITNQLLKIIRKCFPKQRIIYASGNHEQRLTKWLWTHAEVLELKALKFQNLLGLNELNIEYYDNYTLLHHSGSNMFLQHGDTINAGGINAGRNTLIKSFENIAFGHLHRSDQFIINTIGKQQIKSFSIGCLCDLNPEYWCYNNNWNNGFGLIINNVFQNKRVYGREII